MQIDAGRWRARLVGLDGAEGALRLRADLFRSGASDLDAFDPASRHLLIEGEGAVVACARLAVQDAAQVTRGYSAQFYDLAPFARTFPRALEVGRICIARPDPEVPRLLLAALARLVEAEGADVLHGCASFPLGAAPLGRLRDRMAPTAWAPRARAEERAPLEGLSGQMPPMLRSYLSLGAKVSDHAVIDRDLGTVHVHTALPIAAIPPGRARLLTGLLSEV